MSPEILLLIAALLLVLFALVRRPRWSRGLVRALRAAPFELAGLILLVALVASTLLSEVMPLGLAIAIACGIVLIAAHDAVRDYVLGVLLRASGRIRLGDVIIVDGHEGVVAEIGRLNVLLDDARGRLLVPHSKVVRGIVHRRSQRVGPLPHRFEVTWRDDRSHADVSRQIVRRVLLHPRAAAGRDPEVEPEGARTVAVTVYAVSSAHGFEVERAVRDSLGDTRPALNIPAPDGSSGS